MEIPMSHLSPFTYTPRSTPFSPHSHIGQEQKASYRPGVLSILAVLCTAILIVISARRRSGWIAWVVAALYLTTPLIGTWGSLGRPDALAVFLCASGVVLVDRTWKSRMVFFAIPLFLLALLAKQSIAMGLLASLLFLLRQAPRRALELGAITCAIGLAAVGLLQWFTDGWFLFHTVTANLAPLLISQDAPNSCGIFLFFTGPS